MKRFVKIICVIVVMATIATVPVSAETEAGTRASNYFHLTCTYIYQTTGTKFQVWFDLVGVEGMDEIGASAIRVQRSADGTNWTTMFTYLPQYYPQMIATDTAEHGAYVPYHGTEGYYYRALVTFYAHKGNGTGELDRYTQAVYLQPST